jgi:hypothetical protein
MSLNLCRGPAASVRTTISCSRSMPVGIAGEAWASVFASGWGRASGPTQGDVKAMTFRPSSDPAATRSFFLRGRSGGVLVLGLRLLGRALGRTESACWDFRAAGSRKGSRPPRKGPAATEEDTGREGAANERGVGTRSLTISGESSGPSRHVARREASQANPPSERSASLGMGDNERKAERRGAVANCDSVRKGCRRPRAAAGGTGPNCGCRRGTTNRRYQAEAARLEFRVSTPHSPESD